MWIIILILIFLVFLGIVLFNRIVRSKFLVREAYSGIEVQLKRRHELIPNLVQAAKGYMSYEQKTLEEVVALRSKSLMAQSLNELGKIETNISQGLKNIFALAENYPDLKTSANLLKLHESLVEVEDQLQSARRYYNGAVRDYNTVIESFPGIIAANLFNFKPAEFFELEYSTERKTPEVKI